MKVVLVKPYSVWNKPITKDAVDGRYIATFHLSGIIWKEFNGCLFGISERDMNMLIQKQYAIKIN
jgi:hypothetical protein